MKKTGYYSLICIGITVITIVLFPLFINHYFLRKITNNASTSFFLIDCKKNEQKKD